MPLKDTTGRGDATEMQVMAALLRQGRKLLRPISSAMRYDVLIDNEDGTFTRVQCKTGRLRHGRVEFRTYSVSGHSTQSRGYRGQVDAFGVHCPQDGRTYLIPMAAIASLGVVASLRVLPARNGQSVGTRPAAQFLIDAAPLFAPYSAPPPLRPTSRSQRSPSRTTSGNTALQPK